MTTIYLTSLTSIPFLCLSVVVGHQIGAYNNTGGVPKLSIRYL